MGYMGGMMQHFTQAVFTSSGSWTAPAGVTKVIVWGMGGGASGLAGFNGSAGSGAIGNRGGAGTGLQPVLLDVVPNTTYTITIGAGGSASSSTTVNNPGTDTTFGALMTWKGAPAQFVSAGGTAFGWYKYRDNINTFLFTNQNGYPIAGQSGGPTIAGYYGYPGTDSLSAAPGTLLNLSTAGGPGGGGMGGETAGGAGGTPVNNNNGGAGVAAAANSGAGGGGGAGGGATSKTGGQGGAGGSGKMIVMWVE